MIIQCWAFHASEIERALQEWVATLPEGQRELATAHVNEFLKSQPVRRRELYRERQVNDFAPGIR